jgi:hypothetical protein
MQNFMKYAIGRMSINGSNDFLVRKHYAAKEEAKEPAIINAATSHYHDNGEAYHDIAVVEAGMDGVIINVDHPIEMGQEVPVQTTKL